MAIFGAGGFVGRAIVEELKADPGFDVRGVSSQDADLRDSAQFRAASAKIPPRAAWVIAAAVSPDRGVPLLDGMMDNLAMARNLAEAIASGHAARVIFLSSIDVYGREKLDLPLSETSPIRPSSYYAVSKYASELIYTEACRHAGVPLAVLRLPGVYGPGDPHHGPVSSFLRAALAQTPITVYGDGNQRRDLLYVRDIPRIIALIARDGATGVFNAVTGNTMSLNEMLHVISELKGCELPVTYERAAPQFDLRFRKSLLLRHFPSLHFTPLENGLRETYACLLNAARSAAP